MGTRRKENEGEASQATLLLFISIVIRLRSPIASHFVPHDSPKNDRVWDYFTLRRKVKNTGKADILTHDILSTFNGTKI